MKMLIAVAWALSAPCQAQCRDQCLGLEHLPAPDAVWSFLDMGEPFTPRLRSDGPLCFPWETAALEAAALAQGSVSSTKAPLRFPWDEDWLAPKTAADSFGKVTAEDRYDVTSRQQTAKLGWELPLTSSLGTFSVNAEGQAILAPEDPSAYHTFGTAYPTVNQGLARLGLQWHDTRKDEVAVSVGSQEDMVRARPGVSDVALSVKAMLPEPLPSWYVEGKATANNEQTQQLSVKVGTSREFRGGSRFSSSLGLSRREVSFRRSQPGSAVLNWAAEWKPEHWFGFGVRFNYYLEDHDADALLVLELQSPTPDR